MTLFHGSNEDFTEVDLSKSKNKRDFGKGFYTTTIREQALQWGYNMFNRFGGNGIYLYTFAFSPSDDLKFKCFSEINDEWFDFILVNRTMNELSHHFDYVQGPVANDKTVLTITGFIDGLYSREEAMQRLRYNKANDQVSLHTHNAVAQLVLREKRETTGDKLMFNGQDLTFFMVRKIERIVSIITEKENVSFDTAYNRFTASRTYAALHNITSMLWTESAEFIADEYYRG